MSPESTTWPLPEHTAAKHTLLRSYLGGWFPVISSREPGVLYLEGFAGPGIYDGGEPGSPIVAMRALLEHPQFPRWTGRTFNFAFFEDDPRRVASLRREVDGILTKHGRPANVLVTVRQQSFGDGARELLNGMRRGSGLIPTLAFVDPFGFKDASLTLISELLNFAKCELLFNLMFDSVNRFVTSNVNDRVLAHLTELFGCDDYRRAPAAGGDRALYLVQLYEQQLRQRSRFTHVRSFEIFNVERGRRGYYLVFGTRSEAGLRIMKEAMWKVDPVLGQRFGDPLYAEGTLLRSGGPQLDRLRGQVHQHFSGTTATIAEVERFVLVDTDYLPTHVRKAARDPMVEARQCEVVSRGSGNRGYPAGCRLRFS